MAKNEGSVPFEEKLVKAIVPDHLRLFKIPSNWQWVRLGNLGYTNIGLTYKPSDVSKNGVIVLRSSNIQNGVIDYNDMVKVNIDVPESKMSQKGDILICARNGSKALVGKTAIIDANGMSYGAFMAIFRSEYNSLIYYYLNSPYYRDLIDKDVGTTTINQVTQSIIKELPFPLPPLAEQQRIVDRIESLFEKLDNAEKIAKNVLDTFKIRKAAILQKAFTGELTAQWREKNGVGMDSWKEKAVGEFAEVKGGKRLPKGHSLIMKPTEHPYLRIADFGENTIDQSDLQYVSEDTYHYISRYVINKEDVYISIVGSIGKVGTIPSELDGANLTENAARIISKETIPKFLAGYLATAKCQEMIEKKIASATLGKLSLHNIKTIIVLIPTIQEQKNIVQILDNLLEKEEKAKELCDVIEKIDLIKKAILARAFRGELGTNDPSEESAIELLKECLG